MPTYLDVETEQYTSKKMFKRCSNRIKTQFILDKKLVFSCLTFIQILHYLSISIII